jgi:hypothetical protein
MTEIIDANFSTNRTKHGKVFVAGIVLMSVLAVASGFAGAQTTLYSADMATDPGWTFTGLWAYGSGASPDPTAARTTPNTWVGYNLGGNYEKGMPERFATTPAINCTGYTGVTLSFWRYLGVLKSGMSSVDGAVVRVSSDDWTTSTVVWAATAAVKDTAWTFCTYDISSVADNQPNVQVRWVMGPSSNMGMSKSFGWNIDDVLVTGIALGPAVTAVTVETGLTVLVTFNKSIASGATTASNYTLSGTGQGTLADNPDAADLIGGNQYRLTWNTGEMRHGGNITITVANVQDASGNTIAGPSDNTKTQTGGAIGELPGCTVSGPASPTNANSFDFSVTFTESVTGLSEAGITVANGTKGTLAGSGSGPYTLSVMPEADGAVTCRVNAGAARDAVGNNNTESNSFTVESDRTGPNPPVISGPGTATSNTSPTWAWESGGNGGAGAYQYDFDGAGSSGETTETSYAAAVLAEGSHTLQVRERDALGNWSEPGSYSVIVDTSLPTGTIVIDGDAQYSHSTETTLTLLPDDGLGSGVAQVQFSNDGLAWSGWEPFNLSKRWTLSEDDGLKTVYVQFKDAAGNVSAGDITDTITLESVPPTGTVLINGGADFCDAKDVMLALTSDDGSGTGVAQMQFSNDGVSWSGWETVDTGKAWTLSEGDELKTVHVQFKDVAGNVSAPDVTDTITLDTSPPTGTVSINSGADFCSSTDVTLALALDDGLGSGVAQMQFSDDGSNWSGWETASETRNWTLPSGDGLKTVHVQFKDALGKISTADIMDEITLDTSPPTGTVAIEGGALYCNTTSVMLILAMDDGAGSGVTQVQFSNDALNWGGWADAAESKAWAVESGDGLKTVYAQFKDAAGNVSTGTVSDTITLDPTALTAEILLIAPVETCRDQVEFSITFNKPVAPTFIPDAVSVMGLAGDVAVTGTDPSYTVTVALAEPDADGTVAVHVGDSVADQANNHFGGQTSLACHIHNWRQPWFVREPATALKYVGDEQIFTAEANCGASSTRYRWKWNAAKTDGPVTPVWKLESLSKDNRGEYWCEATYDGTVHETGHVTLGVEDHVQITVQPGGADKAAGQSHTFSVAATGGYPPLSYQWRKDGLPIEDAAGKEYAITDLAEADSGTYSVEVLDANGDVVPSRDAVLAVAQGMPGVSTGGLIVLGILMIAVGRRVFRQE